MRTIEKEATKRLTEKRRNAEKKKNIEEIDKIDNRGEF